MNLFWYILDVHTCKHVCTCNFLDFLPPFLHKIFKGKILNNYVMSFRYYKIGVIVLFLHDIADIFLEFSKLCVAFKSRGGKYHLVPDVLSNVGVSCFALVW